MECKLTDRTIRAPSTIFLLYAVIRERTDKCCYLKYHNETLLFLPAIKIRWIRGLIDNGYVLILEKRIKTLPIKIVALR